MKDENAGTIYLIALGAFALGTASYVTAGLMPVIESSFSVSVATAAQLVTAFTLAYGIASPIFVALVPASKQRFGLLLALAIFTLANIGSALSTDYTFLVVTRAVAGIGAGVYLAMGIAAAANLSHKDRRGKSLAVIMGGMASGTVLGVPVSLLIAEQLGWQSVMWLVALLGLISYLGLATRLPAISVGEDHSLAKKLAILRDPKVTVILGVSFLAAVSSLGFYTYIASFMADPQYGGVTQITPFLWVWGLGGVAGSFIIGPLADRLDGRNLVIGILLLLALSLFCIPILASTSPWLTLIPISVWGAVGWALQVPQNNALISARERDGGGNLAVALNESALYLGSAAGAAAGGLVYLFELPKWTLPVAAGAVALLGLSLMLTTAKGRCALEPE